MFFLQENNISKKSSLIYFQRHSINHTPMCFWTLFLSVKRKIKKATKHNLARRMSLSSLPGLKGSMTVEAACALPLFLFFALNLLSVVEMLRFHGKLTYAMRQVGNSLALYGYAYDEIMEGKIDVLDTFVGEAVISYGYIREEIEKLLGEEYLQGTPVEDGKEGLIFTEANLREGNILSFTISYRMELPFPIGEWLSFRTYNCYYARVWTGYDVETKESQVAYIAETGEVYHRNPDCTHLRLSVRKVDRSLAFQLTNNYGKGYVPCEKCEDEGQAMLFITEEGDCYHGSASCSGLKRTVHAIEVERAQEEGYRSCSRCGKEKEDD